MRRKFLFISFCLLLVLNLSGCSGYNKIMYEHLSEKQNYKTYEFVIDNIYVSNKKTDNLEVYDKTIHDDSCLKASVYLGVEPQSAFCDGEYILGDGSKTKSIVLLHVLPENSKILLQNDFYDNFVSGDVIKIKCSDWIYMDTEFYYVIGVEYDEIQYLDSQDGLQNVVDMMDENRSLF